MCGANDTIHCNFLNDGEVLRYFWSSMNHTIYSCLKRITLLNAIMIMRTSNQSHSSIDDRLINNHTHQIVWYILIILNDKLILYLPTLWQITVSYDATNSYDATYTNAVAGTHYLKLYSFTPGNLLLPTFGNMPGYDLDCNNVGLYKHCYQSKCVSLIFLMH